jgi:hypothetical protein
MDAIPNDIDSVRACSKEGFSYVVELVNDKTGGVLSDVVGIPWV